MNNSAFQSLRIWVGTARLCLFFFTIAGTLQLAGQTSSVSLNPEEKEIVSPWLDSLGQLWMARNSTGHIPFKPTTPADSRKRVIPALNQQDVRDSLHSISSDIDLEYNEAVAYFLDVLVRQKPRETELMLGYGNHYLPIADTLLAEAGLPSVLRYLPAAHSSLFIRAVSEKGASGPWFFMYTSARRYGLRVDSYVDERRDFNASGEAGVRMLTDLYEIYGDWQLAIAAYSCGPANVNKAIRRSGGKRTYSEIYPQLPSPERAYFPAFTAMAYVFEHYDDLGLVPIEILWPGKYDTVMIDHQLHLGQVAAVMDLPIDLLRELNPEYRYDIIPGEAGDLILRLPEGISPQFLLMADSIAEYNDSLYFTTPAKAIARKTGSSNPSSSSYAGKTAITYTVRSGDNLGYIASKYHVSISQIKYWNGIRGTVIRTGQRLTIYVPDSKASSYQGQSGKSSTAGKTSSSSSQPAGSSAGSEYRYYTVRSGDNPSTIASRFPGVSAEQIMKLNNISNPRKLYVGQKLKIPK